MANSNLYYTDTGSGTTTLVFLHYFGGSEKTWHPLIELLKKDYRCIAIDLWGFGSSPAPDHEIGIAESVEKVMSTLVNLQLQKFVLIGHSMGGKITVAIAAKQPAGLLQLILVAPSPPVPEPMSNDKRKEMLATFRNRSAIEELIEKITFNPLPDHLFESVVQDHLRISKTGWDGWLNKGSAEDIVSQMYLVQLPVTLVHGSEDPNFTMAFYKEIYNRNFREVNFIEIPNVGHVVPLEATEKLAEMIRKEVSI